MQGLSSFMEDKRMAAQATRFVSNHTKPTFQGMAFVNFLLQNDFAKDGVDAAKLAQRHLDAGYMRHTPDEGPTDPSEPPDNCVYFNVSEQYFMAHKEKKGSMAQYYALKHDKTNLFGDLLLVGVETLTRFFAVLTRGAAGAGADGVVGRKAREAAKKSATQGGMMCLFRGENASKPTLQLDLRGLVLFVAPATGDSVPATGDSSSETSRNSRNGSVDGAMDSGDRRLSEHELSLRARRRQGKYPNRSDSINSQQDVEEKTALLTQERMASPMPNLHHLHAWRWQGEPNAGIREYYCFCFDKLKHAQKWSTWMQGGGAGAATTAQWVAVSGLLNALEPVYSSDPGSLEAHRAGHSSPIPKHMHFKFQTLQAAFPALELPQPTVGGALGCEDSKEGSGAGSKEESASEEKEKSSSKSSGEDEDEEEEKRKSSESMKEKKPRPPSEPSGRIKKPRPPSGPSLSRQNTPSRLPPGGPSLSRKNTPSRPRPPREPSGRSASGRSTPSRGVPHPPSEPRSRRDSGAKSTPRPPKEPRSRRGSNDRNSNASNTSSGSANEQGGPKKPVPPPGKRPPKPPKFRFSENVSDGETSTDKDGDSSGIGSIANSAASEQVAAALAAGPGPIHSGKNSRNNSRRSSQTKQKLGAALNLFKKRSSSSAGDLHKNDDKDSGNRRNRRRSSGSPVMGAIKLPSPAAGAHRKLKSTGTDLKAGDDPANMALSPSPVVVTSPSGVTGAAKGDGDETRVLSPRGSKSRRWSILPKRSNRHSRSRRATVSHEGDEPSSTVEGSDKEKDDHMQHRMDLLEGSVRGHMQRSERAHAKLQSRLRRRYKSSNAGAGTVPNDLAGQLQMLEHTVVQHMDRGKDAHTAEGQKEPIGLQELIDTPRYCNALRGFLERNLCVENLKFLQLVSMYHDVEDEEKRETSAREIYSTFVDDKTADELVNLDGGTHKDLTQRVKEGDFTQDLFDDARQVIFDMVERDVYRRFLESDDYKEMLTGKRHRRGGKQQLSFSILQLEEDYDELDEILEELCAHSTLVQTHRKGLKKFECTQACQLVTWLVKGKHAASRSAAQVVSQRLMDIGMLQPLEATVSWGSRLGELAAGNVFFKDDDEWYKVIDREKASEGWPSAQSMHTDIKAHCGELLLKLTRYNRVWACLSRGHLYLFQDSSGTRAHSCIRIKKGGSVTVHVAVEADGGNVSTWLNSVEEEETESAEESNSFSFAEDRSSFSGGGGASSPRGSAIIIETATRGGGDGSAPTTPNRKVPARRASMLPVAMSRGGGASNGGSPRRLSALGKMKGKGRRRSMLSGASWNKSSRRSPRTVSMSPAQGRTELPPFVLKKCYLQINSDGGAYMFLLEQAKLARPWLAAFKREGLEVVTKEWKM